MPARPYARRMELLFVAVMVLFTSSACGLASPDREAGREYSVAFSDWFYQTNSVQIEAAAVQAALVEIDDDEGLRTRLRELARIQTSLNERFSSVDVHPFWEEHHPGIVEAAARFNAATAHLRDEGSFGPIDPLVEQFRFEEDQLLQAVISCYVQSGPCPSDESPPH